MKALLLVTLLPFMRGPGNFDVLCDIRWRSMQHEAAARLLAGGPPQRYDPMLVVQSAYCAFLDGDEARADRLFSAMSRYEGRYARDARFQVNSQVSYVLGAKMYVETNDGQFPDHPEFHLMAERADDFLSLIRRSWTVEVTQLRSGYPACFLSAPRAADGGRGLLIVGSVYPDDGPTPDPECPVMPLRATRPLCPRR